jgi:hypothetical protein
MKKTRVNGEMKSNYTKADFPNGFVRGKYANRLAISSNVIVLKPEVAAVFQNDQAVNEALQSLITIASKVPKASTPKAPAKKPRKPVAH